ncbi:MAG: SDR family oxidoreductase, partial [Candidatus Fermentibacteraceae bacterium]|nr:SDR family oxidoreductase [Candidatus Fermentibacteraceae bacterium]
GEQTADRIREAGGEAIWIRTDVTRAAQVRSLVKTAAEEYCGLDFAFNNAGSGGRGGWTAESTRSDPGFRMLI